MPAQSNTDRASLWFVVRWTVAFAVAYIITLLLYSVVALLTVQSPTLLNWVTALGLPLLMGLTLALGLGWVMRRYLRRIKLWMLLTGVGVAAGMLAAIAIRAYSPVEAVPASILTGLIVGVLQWPALRHEVTAAGWWILANAIAWPISLIPIAGTVTGVPVTGVITGMVMMWLLNHPKQRLGNEQTDGRASHSFIR
jgi:hypothetical protein